VVDCETLNVNRETRDGDNGQLASEM
jgi:hypothetical protein